MAFTSTLLPLAASRLQYTPSTTSPATSDSGGEMSASGGRHSVRTVTLCRSSRPNVNGLGFSIRGGREHGTGFFVSAVEKASEAHCQGLMVGDQIIRINGFPVEDATHREVLQLIQSQNTVNLKVRSVGMIPVKDSPSAALSWKLVDPGGGGGLPLQPTSHIDRFNEGSEHPATREPSDARLLLNVAPKAKLGCGICKGPDWKPGIYVQFTKENSLARGAGLSPGDQIMQCNSVVFTPETAFNEAVSVLRSTGQLELVVRKGAGLELFPGESSGYNSSASSVAGDQSPDTWPNKRLSIVKEESIIDSDSRLSSPVEHFNQNIIDGRNEQRIALKPNNSESSCTLIHVGPSSHANIVERGGREEPFDSKTFNKLAEICMVSQQLETKTTTVLVEVHQSEEEAANSQSDTSGCLNSSSISSFTSSGANSLCSAISQELAKRSLRRESDSSLSESERELGKSKIEMVKCGLDKEKVEQHEQLMEEFKRAHRKMFAHAIQEKCKPNEPPPIAMKSREERESFKLKRQLLEEQHVANLNQEKAVVAVRERGLRMDRDKQDMTETERELTRLVRRQGSIPPPPPPLPPVDETECAPPLPNCPTPDYDTSSLSSVTVANTSSVNTVIPKKQANGDGVEMQSLESFKLTDPCVTQPKPPSVYFAQNRKKNVNKSSDSESLSSRVSVPVQPVGEPISKPTITIREYPIERKAPTRLDFLPQGPSMHQRNSPLINKQPISSRLHSELEQTLSRANLKDRTDAKISRSSAFPCKASSITISVNAPNRTKDSHAMEPFYLNHKSTGSIEILNDKNCLTKQAKFSSTSISSTALESDVAKELPNGFVNGKVRTSHTQDESSNCYNSVTFNFGPHNKVKETRSVTVAQPNGILKNGHCANISHVQINSQNGLTETKHQQKCIKFGGITTIVRDSPGPKM